MEPATARLALKIQLDDVDALLKALPRGRSDDGVHSERVAFEVLRDELVRKWNEIHGQVYAYSILKEENDNRMSFGRLLDEEQQAERDHEMACRLAGMPVPQRPATSNTRSASREIAADQKASAANGTASGSQKLSVDLDNSQTAALQFQSQASKKPPTGEELVRDQKHAEATVIATSSKRARVDDEDTEPTISHARHATPNTRARFPEPAVLKEDEDGRAKLARLEELFDWSRLGPDGLVTTSPATVEQDKGKVDPIRHGTCSSCLEIHPTNNMLQLPCKDDDETETHVYCSECLRRLFESSITDPSHFPPRCCSKIISLTSCTPFLPQDLITRFLSKREELETPNRTYCSSVKCSRWIRPAHVVGGVATCSVCTHKTCATCKGEQHQGLCPEDKGVKELMNVAQQKHWQTCPNCKEMVELEQGCYHITCRCRHEFCYLCVAKWKTCKCAVWDEHNIVDRPQGANNDVQPVAAAAPAPRLPGNQNAGMAQPRAQAQPPVQRENQPHVGNNLHARRPNRRNRRNGRAHVHQFERQYRSQGKDTACHTCEHEDRWVNSCLCGLKVCWYCTKHPV